MITLDQLKECFEVELPKKAEEYQVLFASAIINPHGPTFNIYYIDTLFIFINYKLILVQFRQVNPVTLQYLF
jgi:hypothetical protein